MSFGETTRKVSGAMTAPDAEQGNKSKGIKVENFPDVKIRYLEKHGAFLVECHKPGVFFLNKNYLEAIINNTRK